MVEDDGRQDSKGTDLLGRLSEIKQRLQSPIPSQADLLTLLLSPLDLLEVVPTELGLHVRKLAVWRGCNNEDRGKAQSSVAWISSIQTLLLERVLVDWHDALEKEELCEVCYSWFAPVAGPRKARGSIYLATLSTMTSILLRLSKHPPGTTREVMAVLPLFAANLSLGAVVESLEAYQTLARRDIMWNSAIRELVALPERVANATGGRGPRELERRFFVKAIASQLEDLVHAHARSLYTSSLLSKLLRSGYMEETTSNFDEPVNIWPTVVRRCLDREKSSLQGGWSRAFAPLPSTSRTNIALSLIAFVDRFSLKRTGCSSLLSGDELRRPGAEGSRFLASETWKTALSLSAILSPLLSSLQVGGSGDGSDSDEEQDEMPLLALALTPSSTGYWSPLTARVLVHSLESNDMERVLTHLVARWSSAARIKTAMWQQEEYLTTALLLVVAQLPSSPVTRLCTEATFIGGVSSHLEHLSPKVRRMGMLVAELVSPTLFFSRAIWEGKGEGREETRVLRAMYHNWPSRERVERSGDADSRMDAFGLSAREKEVAQVVAQGRTLKKEAKSRSLPEKRLPPARKPRKTLIESLGDDSFVLDEGEERKEQMLPALTNITAMPSAPPAAYLSEDEESSSSESDSSDEEGKSAAPPEAAEGKEEFGLGMPEKKKRGLPVYIHQLAPLFRENEREANKLALKNAERLIRKKAGWGGEVNENAVNLAIAILALQNNYGFKEFDKRKTDALAALVAASPALVGPCLAEQYFVQQYSIAQRVCLLNSLAFGARELSEGRGQGKQQEMRSMTDEFANLAIARAKDAGEKRLPEKQDDSSLSIHASLSAPRALNGGQVGPGAATTARANSTSAAPYLSLAGPAFIFPLVNRFWAYLEHTSMSRSRPSGSTILSSPFLLAAYLDTLAILCYCGQNATEFQNSIVPEAINLTLTLASTALSQRGEEEAGGPAAVLGASANLLLLLLDAIWQLDSGRNLLHRHGESLHQVETWAAALFESVEREGGLDRSARSSAAILLRIGEIKHEARERQSS